MLLIVSNPGVYTYALAVLPVRSVVSFLVLSILFLVFWGHVVD